MTWTDIPNASLEPGAPARSVDAIALRDNIAHVRDGNNLMQVFTASGTYTKPAGLKRVKVTVVGGGGGAGNIVGSPVDTAWAGAGGGCAIKLIEASVLGATETVTVGAGGAGGTGSANSSGAAGGTSSFGAHCTATGGGGGLSSSSNPGAAGPSPGAGSGGDVNLYGGAPSYPYWSAEGVANIPSCSGGSYLGDGVSPRAPFAGGAHGANATTPGVGGGTPCESGSTDYNGGNGAAGIVIVEEFY